VKFGIRTHVRRFHDRLVIYTMMILGTVWVIYLATIYGIIPLFFPQLKECFSYWGGVMQVWFIPFSIVAGNIMNRASEKRMKEMYNNLKSMNDSLKAQLAELQETHSELHEYLHNEKMKEIEESKKNA
jgi:hypothetical protein